MSSKLNYDVYLNVYRQKNPLSAKAVLRSWYICGKDYIRVKNIFITEFFVSSVVLSDQYSHSFPNKIVIPHRIRIQF